MILINTKPYQVEARLVINGKQRRVQVAPGRTELPPNTILLNQTDTLYIYAEGQQTQSLHFVTLTRAIESLPSGTPVDTSIVCADGVVMKVVTANEHFSTPSGVKLFVISTGTGVELNPLLLSQVVAASVNALLASGEDLRDLVSEAQGYVTTVTERLEGLKDGGDSLEFTTLIAYEDGRVALAQREDGLDFEPSDILREKIVPGIATRLDTTQGTPLIEFEDGRVALLQKNDGLDFVPSTTFVSRLPLPSINPVQRTKVQINSVNGQSHSTGGPWDTSMTRAYAMQFMNDEVLQVVGLRRGDGATTDNTSGPSLYGYDTAFPATGLAQGEPGANNIGLPYAAFATLSHHRTDLNLPRIPTLTCGHGIGGVPLDQMDSSITGSGSSITVWQNFVWWTSQAKAMAEAANLEIVQGWHVFNHGGSGSTYVKGSYLTQWLALQKQYLNHWTSLGLTQPRYIITQTGGAARTDNAAPGYWSVADDQLDIVERGCAVLGSCDYWYPIYDGNVHWDAYGTSLAGETLAWAMSEVEAGRKWSIHRPKVISNAANLITLKFDLRDDEHLQVEDAAKYAGIGIDAFLGFQLSGATITSVSVEGDRVLIAYTGTPTVLKYARQIQDLTGSAYTAHRGLLRTSLRKRSKFWPSQLLVRPIPTFTLEL